MPEPTRDEIQRAHDRLVAIILGDIDGPYGGLEMQALMGSASVLCWVLGHEHNLAFAEALRTIDEWMKAQGIVEEDMGEPVVREDRSQRPHRRG